MPLTPHQKYHLRECRREAIRNQNWITLHPNKARRFAKAKGIKLIHYLTYLQRIETRCSLILTDDKWPATLGRSYEIHDFIEKKLTSIRQGLEE